MITKMKERPIIFSGSMLRVILEGRETETRIRAQPQPDEDGLARELSSGDWFDTSGRVYFCPYGKPGDRRWVQETHRYWWPEWEDPGSHPCRCRYKADDAVIDLPVEWNEGNQFFTPEDACLDKEPYKWRRSIHMPRWASRITLEVTGVRLERLNAISGADWDWVVEFKRVES